MSSEPEFRRIIQYDCERPFCKIWPRRAQAPLTKYYVKMYRGPSPRSYYILADPSRRSRPTLLGVPATCEAAAWHAGLVALPETHESVGQESRTSIFQG